MPQLDADRYAAEIEASTAGLAEILAEYGQDLPIPTCPEWTLRQLVTHVGRAHRWAAEITRTRSEVFIPFRAVPDGKLPEDRAGQCAWLRAGPARIVGAVREAGSDVVWSFTGPVPAGFWIRRMAHETLVHRADAQLAAGAEPEPGIEAEVAADAIDEWLMLLAGGLGNPGDRADALNLYALMELRDTSDRISPLSALWQIVTNMLCLWILLERQRACPLLIHRPSLPQPVARQPLACHSRSPIHDGNWPRPSIAAS
jgi:uncharacterized protein (TIGR03083 family)